MSAETFEQMALRVAKSHWHRDAWNMEYFDVSAYATAIRDKLEIELGQFSEVLACTERRVETLEKQRDELLAALIPFGAIDLVEYRLPAEFAMFVLRARAAIASVRGAA